MDIKKIRNIFILSLLCKVLLLSAQTLEHPVIFVSAEEKPLLLEKIENYAWAQSLVIQLHNYVDDKLAIHQSSPGAILNSIPDFPANDANSETFASSYASGHNKVLRAASYAGMLYYITEDERYAQFAADILAYYIEVLSERTPATTTISGNYFYDPRTTYPHFAIAYDFVYNFLHDPESTVYNKETNTYIAFNTTKAQKAIGNIVGNALKEYGAADTHGKEISNHPVLTAPGALFPIFCVDDDNERERLFNVFWNLGTKRQNSFKNTILPMFGEQGIWPESTSYSFMPNISLVLNVVDRFKPDMNVTVENRNIFDGVFLFENLRNPDRRFVRYGDSKRENDVTESNYSYVLNMANRKGYDELKRKAEIALLQAYDAGGGRHPQLSNSIFDNYSVLDLFWGEPLPDSSVAKFDYKPTVIIKHAGVALQRNYVQEENEMYGLCGIIGGAHYVHSHCTGIAMELYGDRYVMGPNAGLPPSVSERKLPEHTDYFRLYAGNNTVIVNGTSHGIQSGAWNSNSYLWQNKTINIAAEPKHLEDPITSNFSFATQFLDDNVNNCDQQRTLSVIRTSESTAYYFDIFRSKSLTSNNFHDYIYHNLGDETQISNAKNEPLSLIATERYNNDIGDPVHSPGWKFFEDPKVTDATSDAVNIRFRMTYDDKYMHMFIPGGVEREYTKALGPATREAKNGYVNKKTQIIAIRQQGEAWNKPYVSVFEPSENQNSSVNSVRALEVDNKIVGAVVQSTVGQRIITDYVLSNDVSNQMIILEDENIKFKGRFGIVRKEEQNKTQSVSLYIGEGSELSYYNEVLSADDQQRGFKVVGELDTTYVNLDIEIEAEDYDQGGEGVAYSDRETQNYGNAKDYREAGGVDLNTSDFASNGVVVTRVRPGEWLNYTFNVAQSGMYVFGIQASNPSYSSAAINVLFDDSLTIKNLIVSQSGNWNSYQISESANSLFLDSGMHTLRIYIQQADFNLDKIILRRDLLYNSINDKKARMLKVFPNPSKGQFTILLAEKVPATYKIYTLCGKLVESATFHSETTVTLGSKHQDVYMLEVSSSRTRWVQKIVLLP